MRNNRRLRQQNMNQQQQSIRQSNQTVEGVQLYINFGLISLIFYLIILYILITLIITIIALIQNKEKEQIVIMCILLIPMLIVLLVCTSYFKLLFSEAQVRFIQIPQERLINGWIYQSSLIFFCQYANQSQFTPLKLTYAYIICAIFMMSQNITFSSYYECYDQQNDYHYETQTQDENDYCSKHYVSPNIQGPMLTPLGIMCTILAFLFISYESLNFLQKVCSICRLQNWPSYQYSDLDINIPKVISRSKGLCVVFMINSFSKIIALLVIIILTDNETSYVLIASNIFFHLIMIIILFVLLKILYKNINFQQNTNLLLFNHQILIDSILKVRNTQNRLFQLLILLSCIFTIIGLYMFEEQSNNTQLIINYDIFINYDNAIAQLALIGLILFKYLIFPHFNIWDIKFIRYNSAQLQQNQPIQNQDIQITEQRQVLLPAQQQELRINENQLINNNEDQQNLQTNQNISNYFIYNVELKEKADCVICLQQLIKNSEKNPIVQLKCYSTHIFHSKCINDWLRQNKKCPICNSEFK